MSSCVCKSAAVQCIVVHSVVYNVVYSAVQYAVYSVHLMIAAKQYMTVLRAAGTIMAIPILQQQQASKQTIHDCPKDDPPLMACWSTVWRRRRGGGGGGVGGSGSFAQNPTP